MAPHASKAEYEAASIKAYWKARGIELEVFLVPLDGAEEFGVRSNLRQTAKCGRR
jgi:hypothetical protein